MWAALLFAAVAVRIETPAGPIADLGSEARAAVERRVGTTALDDPLWTPCAANVRTCLGEVRSRMGADVAILVRFLPAITQVRVSVFCLDEREQLSERSVDYPLSDRNAAILAIERAIADLFPVVLAPSTQAVSTRALARDPPGIVMLPWAAGFTAAALAAGTVFALTSASAHGASMDPLRSDDEYRSLARRAGTEGLLAASFFVQAGAAVLATGLAFLVEP